MSRTWVLLLAAGCGATDAAPTPDVSVEVASITLADDCGSLGIPPAAADGGKMDAKRAKQDRDALVADSCTQTSMQLVVKATGSAKPTAIKIKKVELLDPKAKGKTLEVLAAKSPSQWTGKKYETWNESIAASQTLQASYVLASPNWGKLGGRSNAAARTFQVRVTITVGTQDRTIEKQATAPARIEPMIDT